MRILFALAALVATFIAFDAHAQSAGGLQVSPVLIDIPAERGLASFRLRNSRDAEVAFQIEVFAWSQEDGETVLTPTTDIVVAPTTFLVAAGREQIVRLGAAPAARQGDTERSYRLLVRELPDNRAPRAGLRVQLEMSMPVFVRPEGARADLSMIRTRDADGAPAVRITNGGRSRVSFSDHPAGDNVENMPRYLLAGSTIVRRLAPNQNAINLLYADASSTAPQQRTFELSDAPVLADRR